MEKFKTKKEELLKEQHWYWCYHVARLKGLKNVAALADVTNVSELPEKLQQVGNDAVSVANYGASVVKYLVGLEPFVSTLEALTSDDLKDTGSYVDKMSKDYAVVREKDINSRKEMMLPFYYFYHDTRNFLSTYLLFKEHQYTRLINGFKHNLNKEKFYCAMNKMKILTSLKDKYRGNDKDIHQEMLALHTDTKFYSYTKITFEKKPNILQRGKTAADQARKTIKRFVGLNGGKLTRRRKKRSKKS